MDVHRLKIFEDSWNIAIRREADIFQDLQTPFHIIQNPKGCWAADPFIIEYDDHVYVFAEIFGTTVGHGVIGYYDITTSNSIWKPVIIEPFHLSYPHLFEMNGKVYMIPESNESGSLYLYCATSFPEKWERIRTLRSNVRFVDTSLFETNGKLMAITYQVNDNEEYALLLLDIDHPENDKVIDIDNIEYRRPGGRMDASHHIRVAQDCDGEYGKGLVFYHYQVDDDGNYTEKEISRLYPNQIILNSKMYLTGMHTYNRSNNYEVIDLKTRRFNITRLLRRTGKKILNRFSL